MQRLELLGNSYRISSYELTKMSLFQLETRHHSGRFRNVIQEAKRLTSMPGVALRGQPAEGQEAMSTRQHSLSS